MTVFCNRVIQVLVDSNTSITDGLCDLSKVHLRKPKFASIRFEQTTVIYTSAYLVNNTFGFTKKKERSGNMYLKNLPDETTKVNIAGLLHLQNTSASGSTIFTSRFVFQTSPNLRRI